MKLKEVIEDEELVAKLEKIFQNEEYYYLKMFSEKMIKGKSTNVL